MHHWADADAAPTAVETIFCADAQPTPLVIPPSIADLADTLVDLDLISCGLTVLPPAVLRLSRLFCLNLGENRLTALPESFGACFPELKALTLIENRLTRLPDSVGQLSKLQDLYLDDNHDLDTAGLPVAHLARLPKLKSVSLLSTRVDRNEVYALSPRRITWLFRGPPEEDPL